MDDPKVFTNKKTKDTRILRIARGAGRSIREVNELLDQFGHFQKMMKGIGKMKIGNRGQINPRQMSNLGNMLPANLVKQMGGMNGIQNMMKQFGAGGSPF